jgi:membrane protease YdiL (CAAX protease family)
MSDSTKKNLRLKSIEIASLEIIFFFVLPITLLYFKIIPIESRMHILLIFSVIIYGIIKKQCWTNEDLGLTTKNLVRYIPVYTLATAAAFVAIMLFAQSLGLHATHHWWTKPHFLFLFIVVSFFQEFTFRGFLMPLLKKVFPDSFTIITVNALLFSGMHAIYPFPHIGLPFAFVGGLFFAILYHKYPNLILISISHSILNFVVVFFGLFSIVAAN